MTRQLVRRDSAGPTTTMDYIAGYQEETLSQGGQHNALEVTMLRSELGDSSTCGVHFFPTDIANRQRRRANGVIVDVVELTRREPFRYRLQSQCHTLVVSERFARDEGETCLEGLPKSQMRDFSHTLSFVPSGHRFCGWQKPRLLGQVTYLHLDPEAQLLDGDLRLADIALKPRLFFFDQAIWDTATKLKAYAGQENAKAYVEALTLVLAHELIRLEATDPPAQPIRGGLAPWQEKMLSEYIEENLSGDISLQELADIAGLSPFHFARAFKQTFGEPPHRYVTGRRIARAKALLAETAKSVTEIGVKVGFAETSSFTATFRRSTGMTPTLYRRESA